MQYAYLMFKWLQQFVLAENGLSDLWWEVLHLGTCFLHQLNDLLYQQTLESLFIEIVISFFNWWCLTALNSPSKRVLAISIRSTCSSSSKSCRVSFSVAEKEPQKFVHHPAGGVHISIASLGRQIYFKGVLAAKSRYFLHDVEQIIDIAGKPLVIFFLWA